MMKPHFTALCAPRYVSPLAAPIEPPTDKQAHLIECFQAAKPIQPNSVVAAYLAGRGLPPCALSPAAIREAEALYWVNDIDGKPMNLGRFPCMIAAITSPSSELQGLHYTYFEHNGNTWAKLNLVNNETPLRLTAHVAIKSQNHAYPHTNLPAIISCCLNSKIHCSTHSSMAT